MARVNVYLPDELAEQAKAAGLNVSALTQEAVRSALQVQQVNEWLESLELTGKGQISRAAIDEAIQGAKDEIEGVDRERWGARLEGLKDLEAKREISGE